MPTQCLLSQEPSMYSVSIQWSIDDAEYVATSPEFPGLSALASTAEAATRELSVAIEAAIDAFRHDGEPIPEPQLLPSHSGQFRVRVPRSLHRALVITAQREGVSLNTFVTASLARAVASTNDQPDAAHHR